MDSLKQEAASPTTTPQRLQELAHSSNTDVPRAIASNSNTSSKVLRRRVVHNANLEVRHSAQNNLKRKS